MAAPTPTARHEPLPNGDYVRRDGTRAKRVTLFLPVDVARAAKATALDRDLTLSQLVAELLRAD